MTNPKNTETFMLILYRIKRKVPPFHFLRESFTNLLEKLKPFSGYFWSFLSWRGKALFKFPTIYVLLFSVIEFGAFPTSVAHSPAAYKNQFNTISEKAREIFVYMF